MKTPYDVLGVAPGADEQTIANAFRAAAKACHPDLNPEDAAAEQQFKQIAVARDALKNPEWRALYRYLQFRRRHDRRHWIITIASCTLSALLSAGLVSLLQQPSTSEPLIEHRAPLLAANLGPDVGGGRHGFELAGTTAAARTSAGGAAQTATIEEIHAGPGQERDQTPNRRPDLAAFSRAPAHPELTVEAALREIIRERGNGGAAPNHQAGKNCDRRPDRRAGQPPQPAGERCAESSRQSPPRPGARVQRTRPAAAVSGKRPSRTLWSLLGLAAGPPPSARPARHASIQAPRAAQQTRPAYASPNECRIDEGGVRAAPCEKSAGSK